MKHPLSIPLFLLALTTPPAAQAMDAFEIQVYEAETNNPGQAGIELHYNTVVKGRTTPEYDGEVTPHGLTHLTLEPSYGVTQWWELGGYLQMAMTSDRQFYYGGFKLRSKFILPKELSAPIQLGLNVELGRVPKEFEEGGWASEFRPIIAYELGPFLFDFNPIFGWSFSGSTLAPELEPAFKIRYNTGKGFGLGTEYYATLGELNTIPGFAEQEHLLFLVGDLIDGPIEFNVGLGKGLSSASNDWTFKMIFGKTF
ncbi:hypothetical protein WDW37_07515 [Bdellovibrionota bacterium FG-1]